jgi:hypothetical protein
MPTVGIEPQKTLHYYPQQVPAVHLYVRTFRRITSGGSTSHDDFCAVAIQYE